MVDEVQEVWSRVKGWPEEMRLSLASKIQESVGNRPPRRVKKLADLVGLIPWEGPLPSDEEVKRILLEERMKKYGG